MREMDTGGVKIKERQPLTLEELCGKIGKPIWVEDENGFQHWFIVCEITRTNIYLGLTKQSYQYVLIEDYGITWLAYDREPTKIIGNIHDNPDLLEESK